MNDKGFAHYLVFIAALVVIILAGLYRYFIYNVDGGFVPTPYQSFDTSTPYPSQDPQKTTSIYKLYKTVNEKMVEIGKSEVLHDQQADNTYAVYPVLAKDGIYYGDYNTVYKFNLNSGKSEVFYKEVDPKFHILNIQIIDDQVFLTKKIANKELVAYPNVVQNLTTKEQWGPEKAETYSTYRYLFKSATSDVLMQSGGDGCGGSGKIYLVKNNSFKSIQDTGGGCDRNPRYIGSNKSKNAVILANVIGEYGYENSRDTYDVISFKDVVTEKLDAIYDLKKLPGISSIAATSDGKKVVGVIDKKIVIINTETKTVEKEFIIPELLGDNWIEKVTNDRVYISGFIMENDIQKEHKFQIIDLNTGALISTTSLRLDPSIGTEYQYFDAEGDTAYFHINER